ncbi:MAG TPA: hypothetical protein VHY91_18605 [Pirellulales bacterium]|nr:hypothetical protein [Pirellulales bacterium]
MGATFIGYRVFEALEDRRLLSASSNSPAAYIAPSHTPAPPAVCDLTISKVDNAGGSSITSAVGNVTPGQSLTYTIVVHNSGTASATGTTITDPIPADLTGDTWIAAQTGGASGFATSGSGNINQTGTTLPVGSTITYTVTGTVKPTATGTFSNTATVTPSGGSAKSATDTDCVSLPNLWVTKTDNAGGSSYPTSTGSVSPGQTLTYMVYFGNSGPATVSGVSVTDPIPANITGATWTATESGGASGYAPTGSGSINNTVTLPAGSYIKYVVTGTVSPTATGSISNTATATPPVGSAKSATDTDCVRVPNLAITKVDNAGGSSITPSTGNVVPGQSLTYTIVVSNTGSGGVTGASVTDPIPADLVSDHWTATQTGGASGYAPTGTGSINNTVSLPAGSSITYTVTGTVNPTATGSFSNTATVTPPVGTAKSATDTDNIANLTITKVDNAGGSSITPSIGNVSPGQTLVYTIVVGNSGPGNVYGAKINDPIPTDLTGDTWTATQTGGASGFLTTGSGNINQSGVSLPAGSTVTYTVTGTVSATANGAFTNTATVAPCMGPGISAADTDNVAPPVLTISKVDNAGGSSLTPSIGNVTPGQSVVYTIVVNNAGPGTASGATIADPIPAAFTGDTWIATQTGGASGFLTTGAGSINQSGVTMPAGSTITYTVTGTVSPSATGSIVNTATVTPIVGTAVSAADTDSLANLSITKVDNAGGSSITPSTGNILPGQTLTYTVVVSNTGTGNVTGASVTDPIPADITFDSWTATPAGGASGYSPTGTGSISDTVSLPAGSSITYVITGTVSALSTGTLSNTATVTPAAGTAKSATDTDNLADLFVTKSDNAGGPSNGNVVPGQSLTYTIVVSNTGLGNATGVSVADSMPINLTGATWTSTPTGGASGNSPSGSGNINDTVALPAGSSITYTVTGTVSPTATGTLLNTVVVTPANGAALAANDADNLVDLSVTKEDNAGGSSITPSVGNVTPGQSLTYTIVVSNSGNGNLTGATISDPLPAALLGASWTAAPSGGASGFATTGTGSISQSGVSLPAGSSITYTVTGTVNPARVGSFSNTATVTPPVGTAAFATDTDNVANLSITKVDDAGGSSITPATGNVIPGQTLTYTVVVSNTGTGSVTGASVTDPLPANMTGASWTATLANGATDNSPSGTGDVSDTVTLPAGSSITYVITGTVSSTATGTLSNSATVTPTAGTAKSATDTDNLADLSVTKSDNAGGPSNGVVVPGQSLTYTIVVSNTGLGNATGVAVADSMPVNLTGATWTATQTGGAGGYSATGSGNINDTAVSLPAGSSITYTVTGTVSPTATGTLANTVNVTPANGAAIYANDDDQMVDLSVTKTDSAGGSSVTPSIGLVIPGEPLFYTIVVSNTGNGNLTGATVADFFPADFDGATWTATPVNGASGFVTTGTGNIYQTVNLPAGSSILYTVTGTVDPAATGSFTNTVTVTPPVGTIIQAADTDTIPPAGP